MYCRDGFLELRLVELQHYLTFYDRRRNRIDIQSYVFDKSCTLAKSHRTIVSKFETNCKRCTFDLRFRQGRHAVRTKRLLGGGVHEPFACSLEVEGNDSFSLSVEAPSLC